MSENPLRDPIPRSSIYIRHAVPVVMQMEAVECGAACLLSILEYHGKYLPLEQVRKECNVTRDGASVFGIIAGANYHDLLSEAHQIDNLEDLYDLPLPFIAFWNLNHFVVIEGFSRDDVFIMDPSIGHVKITYDQLNRSFSGLAVLFDKSLEFSPSGKKTTLLNSFSTLFNQAKTPFLMTIFISFILIIPQLAVPALTQIFIDNFLIDHITNWKTEFIIAAFSVFTLLIILKFLELRILSRIRIFLSTYLSSNFLWHILRLPYEFYLQRYSGEITNRLQLNESVANGITTHLTTLTVDAILAIIFGTVMFYYDPLIATFGIFMVIADLVLLRYLFKVKLNAYNSYQQSHAKTVGYTYGLLDSIDTIKTSSSEVKMFSQLAGYYTKTVNASQDASTKDILAGTLPPFFQLLTNGFVLMVGATRVMSGDLTMGMLFALVILMNYFTDPVTRLINFNSVAELIKVDVNRLNDVLKNKVDPALELELGQTDLALNTQIKLKGDIELRNITFGYDREQEPILKNISLKIKPGVMMGLVGQTASGKSTLIKLIAGLLDPWEGEIFFDGVNRKDLPRELLVRSIGVVEQDSLLFSTSFKENIAFFDPTIDPSVIVESAKDACLHEEILTRKQGYDYQLTNGGSNLSGGQKQKIEVARVFAKEPSIILLDESLSNVDSNSELCIIKNLRKRGVTSLFAAHRLSSTKFCDEIIVLEEGEITQRGLHANLMEEGSLYKRLVDLEHEIQQGRLDS